MNVSVIAGGRGKAGWDGTPSAAPPSVNEYHFSAAGGGEREKSSKDICPTYRKGQIQNMIFPDVANPSRHAQDLSYSDWQQEETSSCWFHCI